MRQKFRSYKYLCTENPSTMKHLILLVVILLTGCELQARNEIDSLLKQLDSKVNHYEIYSQRKENRLNKLKELLAYTSLPEQQYKICGQLYDEYKTYTSDSALTYARKKLQIADRMYNGNCITDARLNLASIMGTVGMYKEGIDLLNGIDINLYPSLKAYYFHIYRTIYGNMASYAVSNQEKAQYDYFTANYRDSLLAVNPPQSGTHIMVQTDRLIMQKQYDEALTILLKYYPTIIGDTHDRAIIAYSISQAYHGKKERDLEKKWLAVSAIYDLESANKEYISLRSLAFILYIYTYAREAYDTGMPLMRALPLEYQDDPERHGYRRSVYVRT
jgi:hypothetical protein